MALIAIGSDPGVSGAIAFSLPGDVVAVHDVPCVKTEKFRQHEVLAIQAIFDKYEVRNYQAIALLESVHIDQRDTGHIRSAESLVRTHEAIRTLLMINGCGVIDAAPVQWRKVLGLVGGDKEQAIALAIKLYPSVRDQIFYKSRNGRYARNHNRAEAVLMMHAARLLTEQSMELSDDSAA